MPIRLTKAVKALLIACVALFVIQQSADQFFGANLLGWLGLIPATFFYEYRYWQILTYSFLHGDVMHLFFNLLMLAFIGGELEAHWGTRRFLRFYFFCVAAAGALYLFLQMMVWKGQGLQTPMVGASGGIYGLLMAYGLIFGERVLLFMLLFPMKAKYFVWILAAVEFFTTVFSGRGGLSSAAHLGGMIAGFGLLWGRASWAVYQNRRALRGESLSRQKRKKKSHLKLIIDNKGDQDEEQRDPKTWH